MSPEDIDDFLVWAAIGVVLGGRVGYILFYDLARYIANPLDIFAVWQGGMSFHGGFAGVTIAMILFARSRGIGIWTHVRRHLDRRAGRTRPRPRHQFHQFRAVGQAGRRSVGLRLPERRAVYRAIQASSTKRHSKASSLFVVLRLLTHTFLKLKNPGTVSGAFLAGYGLSRIFVEFFREPDQQIGYLAGGWLTMGMVLSAPMVLFGFWAIWRARSQVARSAA